MKNILPSIGSTLRIRSYVPLKGKGWQEAKGDCPNLLLQSAVIAKPLESLRVEGGMKAIIPQVYEYDLKTEAGKTFVMK